MEIRRDFYAENLRVKIFNNREKMGQRAGERAAEIIRDLLDKQEWVNVMFAAAPSQNEVLATLCKDSGIDWSRVRGFHMDEYIGLDASHPAGFCNYLRRTLVDKVPFGEFHFINGTTENIEKEVQRYSCLLQQYSLDLCLMGVGENGHIAFNDPPVADFCDDRIVKMVVLEERCRKQQVHDGCFHKVEEVPRTAVTVTIPGLMAAKQIICTVPGKTKAEAVERLVKGKITHLCPASILKQHPSAELYGDEDSGKGLL